MKKTFFILSIILGTMTLYAQSLNSGQSAEVSNKEILIETAKNVAMVYGSAYVPFFKDAKISEVQVFNKEDYGDSFSTNRKRIRRYLELKNIFLLNRNKTLQRFIPIFYTFAGG